MEVVDSYFTKTEDNNIFMYRVSLKDFYWEKSTYESLDFVRSHYNVKKNKQYMSNIMRIYATGRTYTSQHLVQL